MNPNQSTLSVMIGQPGPNQVIPPGTDFIVTGLATGTGGAEPHPIDSVTVRAGGGTPVSATLGPPPLPEPGTVAYSAAVRITAGVTITVTAVDDIGRRATAAVTVRTVYTTPCSGNVPWSNYPLTETVTPYRTCTPSNVTDIVAIIREAEAAGKHVHAFGSKWSFSDCAITTDYMIDCGELVGAVQTVQKALLPGQSQLLFHVEAGATIEDLYTALGAQGLALITMGGASGQTIGGAISTGTHGGDLFMPPLADSVLALHLVGTGGAQYWIEPSPGITDPSLLQKFVVPGIDAQNIIYDNATFNACLVSLGCMGVIYAVVLRVREAYDLIETTRQTTWQALLPIMPALLRDESNRFLQIAVSPYPDASTNNPCLVTTRTEAAPTGPGARPKGDVVGAMAVMILELDPFAQATLGLQLILNDGGLSDDQKLIKIVQTIMSQAPDQRYVLAENYGNFMAALWPAVTFRGLSYSVMDTGFGQPAESSKPSYSAEVFFPSIDSTGQMPFVAFVNAAISAISAATETFVTGYVSLRFTGATRAILGMQQWSQTCAIEFSCLQGVPGELALYTQILNLASQHGGVLHWGQIIEPYRGNGTVYPGYANWRAIYATMSKNFTARTFENALSARWDLTTPLPAQHGFGGDDLALAGGTGWQSVPVAFSNGDGTFTVTNDGASDFAGWAQEPNVKVLVGDFNGDGRADIALSGVTGWQSVPVAFSNGDGTFTVTNDGASDFAGWAQEPNVKVLVGDFNGDGRADIALTGVTGWQSVPVAFSNGDGTFTVTNDSSRFAGWASSAGANVLVGDFNGDGRADIALTGATEFPETIPVVFSNGDGTFTIANQGAPGLAGWAQEPNVKVLVGDFNGDGRTDIALTGEAGWQSIPVAFSNGDGTWTITNQAAPGFAVFAQEPNVKVLVGDFNGDGRTDIALTGGAGWQSIPVAFSNGDGTWTITNQAAPGFAVFAQEPNVKVLVGDFNGDGRTDIALTGGAGWQSIPVAFSNGDGTFTVTNDSASDFAGWAQEPNVATIAANLG